MILKIHAACLILFCRWLFCLHFLTDQCNFPACFILIILIIQLFNPIFQIMISYLGWFHLFFIDIYLVFLLVFNSCTSIVTSAPYIFGGILHTILFSSKYVFMSLPGIYYTLTENRYTSPLPWYRRPLNFSVATFFLSTRIYFLNSILNHLTIAHVMLKTFTLKCDMYDVSLHVKGYNIPSIYGIPPSHPK